MKQIANLSQGSDSQQEYDKIIKFDTVSAPSFSFIEISKREQDSRKDGSQGEDKETETSEANVQGRSNMLLQAITIKPQ